MDIYQLFDSIGRSNLCIYFDIRSSYSSRMSGGFSIRIAPTYSHAHCLCSSHPMFLCDLWAGAAVASEWDRVMREWTTNGINFG